jgi:hypothetical protein
MGEDNLHLALVEGELQNLAIKALEATDLVGTQTGTRLLLEAAEVHIDEVADFEETHDPREVAREMLIFVTIDPRELLNASDSIRPGDALSRQIRRRQQRLPIAMDYFDQLAS